MAVFISNLEETCLQNQEYRKILSTSNNQQIAVMSIKPQKDIEMEIHPHNDQFVKIEAGVGVLLIGKNSDHMYNLRKGIAFIVPKNTYHQIINTSHTKLLKLFTIYSPPHHPVH